jgi:multisubunit Na+/H+ antiporter MnhB subunit
MSERQTAPNLGEAPARFTRGWLVRVALTLLVAYVLLQAAQGISEEPGGLTTEATEAIDGSGVSHPVTAVLLNFRAYDTFLEVGVLVLAALGVLAVRRESDLSAARLMSHSPLYDDPVLTWLVKLLTPLLVLAGGYLLWIGTSAPGGAFQAGAMLAAAGVALRMSGHPAVAVFRAGVLRVLLLAGFGVFMLVAVLTMFLQPNMLQLPVRGTGLTILAIETAVSLSIAVTLVALFVGAKTLPGETGPEPDS